MAGENENFFFVFLSCFPVYVSFFMHFASFNSFAQRVISACGSATVCWILFATFLLISSLAESLFYKDYNQQSGDFGGGGGARKSVDGKREEGPPDRTLTMIKASDSLTESMKQVFPVSINASFICNMEPVQPTIFFAF